jgi:regulator of replication initiation timing
MILKLINQQMSSNRLFRGNAKRSSAIESLDALIRDSTSFNAVKDSKNGDAHRLKELSIEIVGLREKHAGSIRDLENEILRLIEDHEDRERELQKDVDGVEEGYCVIVKGLNNEITDLKAVLVKRDETNSHCMNIMERERDELFERVDGLSKGLEIGTQEIDGLKKQAEFLLCENQGLVDLVSGISASSLGMVAENKAVRAKLDSYHGEKDIIMERCDVLANEKVEAEMKCEELTQKIAALECSRNLTRSNTSVDLKAIYIERSCIEHMVYQDSNYLARRCIKF